MTAKNWALLEKCPEDVSQGERRTRSGVNSATVIPFPQALSAPRQLKQDFPYWQWLTEEYIEAYERLMASGSGVWLMARSGPPLPEVDLPRTSHSLANFSCESGQILGPTESLFIWQETVVEIIDEPWSSQPTQHKLALGGFKIRPMSAARFKGHFLSFIRPLAIVKNRRVFRNPSTTEMTDLLENAEFQKHLPVLTRICPIPIPLLDQGKPALVQSGYNPAFGIYCPGGLRRYRDIGLDRAKEWLDKALSGFQFKTEQDRVHAIASILTPFLRGVIGFDQPVPCWFFKGNRPRVGKD